MDSLIPTDMFPHYKTIGNMMDELAMDNCLLLKGSCIIIPGFPDKIFLSNCIRNAQASQKLSLQLANLPHVHQASAYRTSETLN